MVRKGPKGAGQFSRVSWGEALEAVAAAMVQARETHGAESILPVLLWRVERPADAGRHRPALLPPAGRLAPAADAVRGADRGSQHGALRQDAVGRLPGLPACQAAGVLGHEPRGVRHSRGAVHPRGHTERRPPGGDRPARDAAGEERRPAPRRPPRHRHRRGTRGAPAPVRVGAGRRRVSRRARDGSRPAAGARDAVDLRAGRRNCRCGAVGPSALCRVVRGIEPCARALRMGPRAESQRRQRGAGGDGAASRRREVRRARGRIRHEQLCLVGHHANVARHAGAVHPRDQHEPARGGAHRDDRSARVGALRLQLQPRGHRAGPAPRAPRPRTRRPVHGRVRPGCHRHCVVRRRGAARDDLPRSNTTSRSPTAPCRSS